VVSGIRDNGTFDSLSRVTLRTSLGELSCNPGYSIVGELSGMVATSLKPAASTP